MHKPVPLMIVAVLLFSSFITDFDVEASPGTIRVPTDFPTIQEAINTANEGDTIFVYNGTYFEHIVVNKTVSLVGENKDSTIIDGTNNGTVVYITANSVSIAGFTVQNGFYDIYLYYSDNSTVSGNIVTHSTYSTILLDNSDGNAVNDNTVTNSSEPSIYLYYSDGNTISHNVAANNFVGIWLHYSTSNTVNQNNVTKNSYGIWLSDASNNNLSDNNMTDNTYNFGVGGLTLSHFIQEIDVSNTVNGKPIYYWINQHDKQIPLDAGYVAAVNSTNIKVKNLDLRNNADGVLFAYSTNSTIEDSNVTHNYDHGIHLYYSEGNTISGNNVTNNPAGISLDKSSNNSVSGNNVTGNNQYGVWLHYSSNTTISHNTLRNNVIGVMLYNSDSNMVTSNNVTGNSYGAWLSDSKDNTFYHNNFNNTDQIRNRNSVSAWDDGYPSGGNYWSDYTGEDLDGDGIGDTPYVIDGNNQDRYPLMKPYVWSPISGDVNGDGKVDASDLFDLSKSYGSKLSKPNWNPNCDFNGDGKVDASDLFDLSKNYGKTI